MTTATNVHPIGLRTSRLSGLAAARIRALIGDRETNRAAVADAAGIGRVTFGRRVSSAAPESVFTIDELEAVARVLNTSLGYLLGFTDDDAPPSNDPDDGAPVRHQGLEPRTRWLRVIGDERVSDATPAELEPATRRLTVAAAHLIPAPRTSASIRPEMSEIAELSIRHAA